MRYISCIRVDHLCLFYDYYYSFISFCTGSRGMYNITIMSSRANLLRPTTKARVCCVPLKYHIIFIRAQPVFTCVYFRLLCARARSIWICREGIDYNTVFNGSFRKNSEINYENNILSFESSDSAYSCTFYLLRKKKKNSLSRPYKEIVYIW